MNRFILLFKEKNNHYKVVSRHTSRELAEKANNSLQPKSSPGSLTQSYLPMFVIELNDEAGIPKKGDIIDSSWLHQNKQEQ
jgi:hypothetical protein